MGLVSVKSQVLVLYFKIMCSYIAVLLKSPSISEIIKNASIDQSGQTTSLHKDFFKGVCCIIFQYLWSSRHFLYHEIDTILRSQMAMLQICYTSIINCAVNIFVSVPTACLINFNNSLAIESITYFEHDKHIITNKYINYTSYNQVV